MGGQGQVIPRRVSGKFPMLRPARASKERSKTTGIHSGDENGLASVHGVGPTYEPGSLEERPQHLCLDHTGRLPALKTQEVLCREGETARGPAR